MTKILVDFPTACEIMSVGKSRLNTWINKGLIHPVRVEAKKGVTRLFKVKDLEKLADRMTETGPDISSVRI